MQQAELSAQVFSRLAALASSTEAKWTFGPVPALGEEEAAAAAAEMPPASPSFLGVFTARVNELVSLEKDLQAKLTEFSALDREVLANRSNLHQLQALRDKDKNDEGDLVTLQTKCRELQTGIKQLEEKLAAELQEMKNKTKDLVEKGASGSEDSRIVAVIESIEQENIELEREVLDKQQQLENLLRLVQDRAKYKESSARQVELQAQMASAIREERARLSEQNDAQIARLESVLDEFSRRAVERRAANQSKRQDLSNHRATISDSRGMLDRLQHQKTARESLKATHEEIIANLRAQIATKDVELINLTVGASGQSGPKEKLLKAISEQEAANALKATECRDLQQALRARGGGVAAAGGSGTSSSGH